MQQTRGEWKFWWMLRLQPVSIGLFATVICATHVTSVSADDKPFQIGPASVWYLLGGVTSGATVALAPRGGYVGGELSLARLKDSNYVGVFADGYYDFGIDGTYVHTGIELGRKIIGVDAGPALRFASGRSELGASARIHISAGVFGIYLRYSYFDSSDPHVLQVGAMLKMPLLSPFER
jgi:hypothetical protein